MPPFWQNPKTPLCGNGHKALQTVLGSHVHQAGSLVVPDYLRFDFTHFSAMTAEELGEVSRIVNESILELD